MQSAIRLLCAFIDGHAGLYPIIAIIDEPDADIAGHAIVTIFGERIEIKCVVKPDFCHRPQLARPTTIAT